MIIMNKKQQIKFVVGVAAANFGKLFYVIMFSVQTRRQSHLFRKRRLHYISTNTGEDPIF